MDHLYPKCKYHPDGRIQTVKTPNAETLLGPGWFDTPADFPEIEAPAPVMPMAADGCPQCQALAAALAEQMTKFDLSYADLKASHGKLLAEHAELRHAHNALLAEFGTYLNAQRDEELAQQYEPAAEPAQLVTSGWSTDVLNLNPGDVLHLGNAVIPVSANEPAESPEPEPAAEPHSGTGGPAAAVEATVPEQSTPKQHAPKKSKAGK